MKGIYCLIVFLDKDKAIRIGKKAVSFPRGYYFYVGSALNNVEKRIQRHYSKRKKLHWHIDYFLKHARIVDTMIKRNSKDECGLSRKIKSSGGRVILKGFGSSDCKCDTHLYYFPEKPIIRLKT